MQGCMKKIKIFDQYLEFISQMMQGHAILCCIIIIIITDLYSAFRSEDTGALDAAQEDSVSLNRCVFKWHLKVRMFSHSRISGGREFQVGGVATEKCIMHWGTIGSCQSAATSEIFKHCWSRV